MQITSDLRPMFSYSLLTILFFLILILLNIFFILKKDNKKEKQSIPTIVQPNIQDKESIKLKFLKEIDLLKKQLEENKLTTRKAYQRLSVIIRTFIFQMTSIKIQNYTLEEIKKINLPIITTLIEEYYDPEFSVKTEGNIIESIEKTRQVIQTWK